MGQEEETHCWGDSLRWCGEYTLIYRGDAQCGASLFHGGN